MADKYGRILTATNGKGLNGLSQYVKLAVGFNKEVGKDSCLYWKKDEGSLCELIDISDAMDSKLRSEYGLKAKERIESAFSWEYIGKEYKRVWTI